MHQKLLSSIHKLTAIIDVLSIIRLYLALELPAIKMPVLENNSYYLGFPGGAMVKNQTSMQET